MVWSTRACVREVHFSAYVVPRTWAVPRLLSRALAFCMLITWNPVMEEDTVYILVSVATVKVVLYIEQYTALCIYM